MIKPEKDSTPTEPQIEPVAQRAQVDVESSIKAFYGSLDAEMKERGSQMEMSRETGLHHVYLSKLRKGRQMPSLETALRISKATGKTLDQLTNQPKINSPAPPETPLENSSE
jgi:DNA-binding XRE family transcriptional regulator